MTTLVRGPRGAGVLIALALASASGRAQTDGALSAAAMARIDSVAQAELAQTRTPGASLVIVRGDRVVYAKGYGVASVETKQPVAADALFRLGSTTKMMTSLAALSLASRGVVDLDQPIGRLAPAITSPRLRGVTLRQLLTHNAGLLDYTSMAGPHDDAGQPNADAIDKAAPRIVGKQKLDDEKQQISNKQEEIARLKAKLADLQREMGESSSPQS